MRKVSKLIYSNKVIEGAGVRLSRVFGYETRYETDPFLLLDHFGSKDPDDYIKGFPWHPHRGIETVTYMLSGSVEHEDSLGNKGIIYPGDVQWMSAGKGIIHQEMPLLDPDILEGFQLWVNLSSSNKMIDPVYRGIRSNEIKSVETRDGIITRIIAGTYNNVTGPVTGLSMECIYLDVSIPEDINHVIECDVDKKYIAYIFKGTGYINNYPDLIYPGQAVILEGEGPINITSHGTDMRFLILAGKPLKEDIAWSGPIVMNTQQEIEKAFDEYRKGKFI